MDQIELLKQITLFATLNDEQLQVVSQLMTEKKVSPGQFVLHEGDQGNELFIVTDGMVEAVKNEHGRLTVVSILGKGACIGELAVLADIPRTASIRAKTETSFFVIGGNDFQQLLERYPKIALAIIRRLVFRLQQQE